jgi:uncharacterized protein YdaU (DUF1376 family)
MPLFFGDFLASTAFWKGEEQALYLLLLGYQWASGPLPGNITELASSVRYDLKLFTRLWKRVGPKFVLTSRGFVNSRLESIRTKSREVSAKRAHSGAKGGEAKKRQFASSLPQQNGSNLPEVCLSKASEALYSHPIQSNPEEKNEEEEPAKVGGGTECH